MDPTDAATPEEVGRAVAEPASVGPLAAADGGPATAAAPPAATEASAPRRALAAVASTNQTTAG